MHIDFDPNNVDWIAHIQTTTENGYQFGGGGGAYTAFTGIPYQRGAGIGSIFRSLLRYLIPIGKEAGAAIGRQGLESGVRVLSNVLDGRDLRHSLADEGRTGLKNLLEKASLNLSNKKAETSQSGGSSAFDFKRYKKQLSSTTGGMNTFHSENTTSDNADSFRPRQQKTINKRARKRKLPHSSIGPPLLPSTVNHHQQLQQQQLGTNNKPQGRRNIRIDSLGAY